jgi:hypothetical protein
MMPNAPANSTPRSDLLARDLAAFVLLGFQASRAARQ